MKNKFLILSTICVFSLLTQINANTHSLTIQENCVIEWSYYSTKTYANPFRDIEIDIIVNKPSGINIKIPGFWAGENEWRFRFSSNEIGKHSFITSCSDKSNNQLNNKKGVINVIKYEGNNQLYLHGGIKVSENNHNFEHNDGTPFFWLADQWWHGMTTRLKWPEDFQTLTNDRKKKGFSAIGFAIGFPCDIKPFDSRGKNEAGDPWVDSTFSSINPAYFDLTDLRINHMVSKELIPCIMGSWGYYIKWSGVENMKLYYRYLIARYAAYPISWILAGEVTLAYYSDLEQHWDKYKTLQREQWSEVGRYLQKTDPYNRLVTVHPGPGIWDGKPPLNDMDVLDFIFLQSGHEGFHSLPKAMKQVKDNIELYPNKPVLHGEVCFEGMSGSCRDDVQRFLFWSNILSGTAGFSYGVEGIWQFNTEEELFGASPNGNVWGIIPWEQAYLYPGALQVGIGKKIMEEFEWWRFEPMHDLIECKNKESIYSPYYAGISGEIMVIYMPLMPASWNPYKLINLKPDTEFYYWFIDPMNGKQFPKEQFISNKMGEWRIPETPVMRDFVLIVEDKGK